jgi:hypothetical protein
MLGLIQLTLISNIPVIIHAHVGIYRKYNSDQSYRPFLSLFDIVKNFTKQNEFFVVNEVIISYFAKNRANFCIAFSEYSFKIIFKWMHRQAFLNQNADMLEEMQIDSLILYLNYYIVQHRKGYCVICQKKFDKKYYTIWYAIDERSFELFVTHETKYLVDFYVD